MAKSKHPKVLNDRPVAPTSLVMKSFERLMKKELHLESWLDPLQFAYKAGHEVRDATATLLNLVLKYLDGSRRHTQLLCLDFSSAFNTTTTYFD